MGIKDEYLAFCFDEVALYLTAEATDKEGRINWNKLRWRDGAGQGGQDNQEFMEFVKKHGG